MTRFYAKMMLALLILFFAAAAVIRAQPYDDSELRAFLTPPEGCPAPCFMGIRPGVTTVEEAITILENSAQISKIEKTEFNDQGYAYLTINWNERLSPVISNDMILVRLTPADYLGLNWIVGKFEFYARKIAVGDIYNHIGFPTKVKMLPVFSEAPHSGGFSIRHEYIYPNGIIAFSSFQPCFGDRGDFLMATVQDMIFVAYPKQLDDRFALMDWEYVFHDQFC